VKLIEAGIEPPGGPDPHEMGKEALMKLSVIKLCEMNVRDGFTPPIRYRKDELIKVLLYGPSERFKSGKEGKRSEIT
jgi:hypothetical protein